MKNKAEQKVIISAKTLFNVCNDVTAGRTELEVSDIDRLFKAMINYTVRECGYMENIDIGYAMYQDLMETYRQKKVLHIATLHFYSYMFEASNAMKLYEDINLLISKARDIVELRSLALGAIKTLLVNTFYSADEQFRYRETESISLQTTMKFFCMQTKIYMYRLKVLIYKRDCANTFKLIKSMSESFSRSFSTIMFDNTKYYAYEFVIDMPNGIKLETKYVNQSTGEVTTIQHTISNPDVQPCLIALKVLYDLDSHGGITRELRYATDYIFRAYILKFTNPQSKEYQYLMCNMKRFGPKYAKYVVSDDISTCLKNLVVNYV